MTSNRPAAPLNVADVDSWDGEADVVVVGYGVSGASTAITAAAGGLDVLVLERSGGWGGAAALSGGFIYLGGGTPLQKECGFDDTPEEMFKFLMAAMGPGADPVKTKCYCDDSVMHYQWLIDNGVEFKPEFFPHPGHIPAGDQGLMYSGGENAWPFNTIAKPAPRGHVPRQRQQDADRPAAAESECEGGYWLMAALAGRCDELGVRSAYDVRIDRLIVDSEGRAHGVNGHRLGKPVHYRAGEGVVLASGSFNYNDELMDTYVPTMRGKQGATIETHDGQALLMARAIGADLGRMDGSEVWAHTVVPEYLSRGIVVNQFGQRFVTEDTYPGRVSQFIHFHADDRAYLIIDDEIYENTELWPLSKSLPKSTTTPIAVADKVEELEREVGFPEGSLQATVTLYNNHAENGHDPVFHKNSENVKPLRPPFGVLDLSNSAAGFPLGGLRTTVDGEVLHVLGHTIPGLYAVGRAASGIPVWGYASGTSLGDGSFFGRRAGLHLAAN